MFAKRPTRRVRSLVSASAFEALEERRLMRSPVDLPALPPLPAAPPKPPVVEAVQPPVQNPGWRRPTAPIYFEGEHGHEGEPEFVVGPKWFQSGGPGTPLMLSYSYGSTLTGGLGSLTASQVRTAVEEAYQLWSAVTPLQFEQVADWGPGPTDVHYPPLPDMPVMRFEQHGMDGGGNGTSNELAHAWMPFWGTALAGDVHFDGAEPWSTHPSSGIDLLEVATHEIGHGLGLDHQPATINAIMNPLYGARFSGPGTGFLLADDIAGIQAQYGAGLGFVLNGSGTMFISGTAGANTITLNVIGGQIMASSSGLGSFARSAAGVSRIVINGRGGNDVIRVESNGGIATEVNAGAGDDFIDFSFGFRDLDNITGNTNVSGGAGNDRISIFDHNNAPASTYTITSARFDRPGWGGFFYAADVESESLVTGTAADTVNVLSTFANQPVILNSNGGNDVVNIGNGSNGMQSIGAWVQVNNTPAFTTLNLNDAASTVARTAYVDSIYAAGYTFIGGLAPETITANNSDMLAINLTTGRGNDTVNVTRNSEVLNLNSGGGLDTVNVGDNQSGVQLITGPVTVNNSPSYTTLNVNDAADTVGRSATIDLTTINAAPHGRLTGLSPAAITWKIADISFTNPLRIDAGGGNDAFTVAAMADYRALALDLGGGSDTVDFNATGASTTNVLNAGAGTDAIRVNGTSLTGPLVIAPSSGNDDVRVNLDGAGTADVLFNATQRIGSLLIGNGGTAKVSSSGDIALVTGNVNIATGGQLDLSDEDMIWDYTGASPVNGLRQLLAGGYNGGAWNGSGIMSSAAGGNTAIGYAESADLFTSFPATFAGQAVDSTALLLKHTFYGDANLDGTVNIQDFNRLANNFGQADRRWSHGDFNFDAAVNLQDFSRLSASFGQSGLAPAGGLSMSGGDDEAAPSLEDLVARD